MSNEKSSEVRQAGVIAFRKSTSAPLEVLLVRPSSGRDEWLFPKGHIEPNEAEAQCALRELREEAGAAGHLIGAVDHVPTFISKREQVAVRFYIVEVTKENLPSESRERIWLPLSLAGETLTHFHNRLVLSEALPIIEGHLACSSDGGDNAFREFLQIELQHTTESFLKSEEDGERRAKFYLTLVAGVGAVLAFMMGDGKSYRTDEVLWPLVVMLAVLLVLGYFVTVRVITRNQRTDEYLEHLRRMRRWFTPNASDPRRRWVAFDPFKRRKARELSYMGPLTGGWLEMLLLVNAILAGVLVGAVIDTCSWPLEVIVSMAGAFAAWLLFVSMAKRRLRHSLTAVDIIQRAIDSPLFAMSPALASPQGAMPSEISEISRLLGRALSQQHAAILKKWNGIDLGLIRLFGTSAAGENIHGLAESQIVRLDRGTIIFADDAAGHFYVESERGDILRIDPDGEKVWVAQDLDSFFKGVVFGAKASEWIAAR